jgi:hypothetical protein
MVVVELEKQIRDFDVYKSTLETRESIFRSMRELDAKEKEKTTQKLERKYMDALINLLNKGAANPPWSYVMDGVIIEFHLSEPKINSNKVFSIEKINGNAVLKEEKPEKPHAVCELTWGALEYICQSQDYLEVGRRLLRCRRYPTEDMSLTWRTLVTAMETYENGLFHFYRKLGMF